MDVRFVFTPMYSLLEDVAKKPRIAIDSIGQLELPKALQKMRLRTNLMPPSGLWGHSEAQTPRGVGRLYGQYLKKADLQETLRVIGRRGVVALHVVYRADLARQCAAAYELRNYLVKQGLPVNGTALLKGYIQQPRDPGANLPSSQASLF